MRIGLALGGGGARAFAHIGVLRALEEINLKVDYIVGTSMGAVIGGLYALNPQVNLVESLVREFLDRYKKDIFSLASYGTDYSVEEKKLFLEKSFRFVKDLYLWNLRIIKPYLVNPRPFFRIFRGLFKSSKFSDCQIPFLCVAVDLFEGEVVVIKSGSLFRGIVASCALPGVFPPLRVKDSLLVDGGILMPLPARVLKPYVNFIIGVSVEGPLNLSKNIKNTIDILFTVDRIRYKSIIEQNKREADFIFSPSVSSYVWSDFKNIDKIIEEGYRETKRKMNNFRKKIVKLRWLPFLSYIKRFLL